MNKNKNKKAVKKIKKDPRGDRELPPKPLKTAASPEPAIHKTKIKVIGIGGGGSSIVSEISQIVKKASFFIADTDTKSLKGLSPKIDKFLFGQKLTMGFGAGMNSEVGKEVALSEKDRIKKALEGYDLIILVSCLGGGVGSGASPVFAQIAKNLGALTYGIFTLPFKLEGDKKMNIAKDALAELKTKLNALSVIPNERIFQIVDKSTSLKTALSSINRTLADGLESLIDIVYQPGLINIDFADLKTTLEGRGRLSFLNSIELPSVENEEAIQKVINCPLYPYSVYGAKGLILNIAGQKDLSLSQVSQISRVVSHQVNREAKIIFGISQARSSKNIKVTVFATGCSSKNFFEEEKEKPAKEKKTEAPKKAKKGPKKKKIKIKVMVAGEPGSGSFLNQRQDNEMKVRKNALQVKIKTEEEEGEILAREKSWDPPSFLKKKFG